MNRIKYLLKNMGILAISSFGARIISFFFVPLYTSILTTTEYGIFDLFNITIGLMIPYLTLNIKESVIRFAISEDADKKSIFSIGLKYGIKSTVYFVIILLINNFFEVSSTISDYGWFILFLFIVQTFQGLVSYFARGIDRLKDIAISSAIFSLSVIVLNIITLIPLRMGLIGYLLSNSIGYLIQTVYLFVRCKGWEYISFKDNNIALKCDMVRYSSPMIINSTAWWINSLSDRYIVLWMCGVAESGIYSVASKIPSIVDMFQGIFSQAWTLLAVKEYDAEDKVAFFSEMYTMYNMIMIFASSGLIIISRFLSRLLYAKEFYLAWKFVPFLTLAVLFGALAGYFGAIFSAAKDSKIFAFSTIIGAIINIILNLILIKTVGTLGAAFATAISYTVIYVIRFINLQKYIKLRINLVRDCLAYIILYIQSCLFLFFEEDCMKLYLLQFLQICIIIFLFRSQLYMLKDYVMRLLKARR